MIIIMIGITRIANNKFYYKISNTLHDHTKFDKLKAAQMVRLKDKLEAFDNFKNKQQSCMK